MAGETNGSTMSATGADIGVDAGRIEGSIVATDERGSSDARSSSSQGRAAKGILTNAHEAPKKPPKQNESSLRSALKAAFVPPQPGKQIKTDGKPLGKTFERKEPLPQKHEGAEVLKTDPRGENASVGDGVVLSPSEPSADDASPFGSASSDEIESLPGGSETASDSQDTPWTDDNAQSASDGFRGRSGTMSSVGGSSQAGSVASTSTNNPCQIKFAPLPTSGRLKRANSITIGVAARSQLLHSQGAGRTSSNTSSNASAWQAQLREQQQRQQQQQQQHSGDKYSGIQEQQQQGRGRSAEPVDLGVELRKSATSMWNRVRRGSSVSSSASSGEGNASGVANTAARTTKRAPSVSSVTEEDHEIEQVTGEKTPRRPGSPLEHTTAAEHALDSDHEADGTRTPRHSMQRRVSTGTFIGAQSFREMEEKRKRANREEYESGDAEQYCTPTEEVGDSLGNGIDDNELSAQFAEKLGRTGASRVQRHTNSKPWHPGMRATADGPHKDTEIVNVGGENGRAETVSSTSSGSESEQSGGIGNDDDNDDEDDDEEEREAERLADEALHGHSAQATQAAGVEKMEKKRSALSRLVGA